MCVFEREREKSTDNSLVTRVYVRGVILVREDVRFSGSPASVLLEVSLEHLNPELLRGRPSPQKRSK